MKHCDLSVGDWIIIENCYAYILAVHDIFYETFHTEVQENSSLKGDYVYSLIVYHIYCTTKGKKINRKPAYFTHGVEDYRSLAPDVHIPEHIRSPPRIAGCSTLFPEHTRSL